MELNSEQLKVAEKELKKCLPLSMKVYGCLLLKNTRTGSDPMKVFVDRWPEFSVIICKPECEQKGDFFKDILVLAKDEALLAETIKRSSIIDWTRYLCFGTSLRHKDILKAVGSEKGLASKDLAVCHMMTLEDVSNLPCVDRSGISLASLDESHIDLVNRTWKFSVEEEAVRMIRNMLVNFPSCCVLDADGKPIAWILTYASCAMGMLYTLPEHRGKGYAKLLVSAMAKRLHAEGLPVYCFIEEENMASYRLFKSLGFTEDPSYRESWVAFNS